MVDSCEKKILVVAGMYAGSLGHLSTLLTPRPPPRPAQQEFVLGFSCKLHFLITNASAIVNSIHKI